MAGGTDTAQRKRTPTKRKTLSTGCPGMAQICLSDTIERELLSKEKVSCEQSKVTASIPQYKSPTHFFLSNCSVYLGCCMLFTHHLLKPPTCEYMSTTVTMCHLQSVQWKTVLTTLKQVGIQDSFPLSIRYVAFHCLQLHMQGSYLVPCQISLQEHI